MTWWRAGQRRALGGWLALRRWPVGSFDACRIAVRRVARGPFGCVLIVAGGLCSSAIANGASSPQPATDPATVARGAWLAKAANCAGCHTAAPSEADGAPQAFAGGRGMESPFGTIYASNITPDPDAGIGRYTLADFDRALRRGIAPGDRRLYPAMPWPSFAKLDDTDVRALYTYFMHGVAPVAKPAPRTQLPFPFDQRWALSVWSWLFAPADRYQADPSHDAQWNRGAYFVQSLGHCGACHTPRGVAYEELGDTQASPRYLTGGSTGHWFAPNLTGDPETGLGRVSAQDLAAFLKRGHGGGLVAFGSMAQVVEDSTQYLGDDDLAAIAVYLKSLPARASAGAGAAHSPGADAARAGNHHDDAGAQLFQRECVRCHQADGGGVPQKYPRLAGNPAVLAPQPTSLIRLLVEGGHSPVTDDGPLPRKMPSFAGKLTDAEMASVLSWVRSAWGNDAAPVSTRDVTQLRAALHE